MFRNKKLLFILLLITLGFVFYFRSFTAAMFWDDEDFILKNLDIQNFAVANFFTSCVICGRGLVDNYYRPVLQIIFAFEWLLFGQNPIGYHVISVLFHVVCSVLVFINANIFLGICNNPRSQKNRIVSDPFARGKIPHIGGENFFGKDYISFFIALIFLVHPLQTESVVYVNSLGDSLSVFFMMLGVFANFKNKKFFVWLFGVLALLSKETAIVYFAIVMLLDYYISPEHNFNKRVLNVVKNNFYLLLTTAIYFLSRITFLNFQNTLNAYNVQNAFTSSVLARILVFAKAISVYIGVLFYPINLHMERSIESASVVDFGVIVGLLTIAFGLIFGLYFFYKRHILGFAILLILVLLFPTSNILVPVNGTIYEHWLYLPIVGVAGILLYSYCKFLSAIIKPKVAGAIFTLGFLPLLFYCSYARQLEWQTAITFYESTLKYAPRSLRIVNNLAMAYADDGQTQKAVDYYKKAIELDPHNAVPYHNLGNAYMTLGKKDLALEAFTKVVSIQEDFLFSYGNLINLLLERGKVKEAQKYAALYLKHDPKNVPMQNLLNAK